MRETLRDIKNMLIALTAYAVVWAVIFPVFGAEIKRDPAWRTGVHGETVDAGCEETAPREIEIYAEGTSPVPEWYDPTEPMAAEWVAEEEEPVARRDIGCTDAVLVGWDGHWAQEWEFELYVRIVYLEFWGCSPECCEAGADSILRLWESGYFGTTLGGVLSATAEDGSLVYSPYAYVSDWEYDAAGLADIRALCEERFASGPEWIAPFFRLYYYHPWAIPAYEIDGVYFSVAK